MNSDQSERSIKEYKEMFTMCHDEFDYDSLQIVVFLYIWFTSGYWQTREI